jgi:hypothetical protein
MFCSQTLCHVLSSSVYLSWTSAVSPFLHGLPEWPPESP